MLRHCRTRLAGVGDFIDSAYLRNTRPRVPGGSWQPEYLRVKSTADLQQLWFMLLRERNMLHSMRDHYVRHTEELGAFPAPSRITMVEDSMKNIKSVMQERDFRAVDTATKTFHQRIKDGVYRYPAGPQPPAATLTDTMSAVRVTFAKRVEEDRLRELLGRYDVFENHRGIASLQMEPSAETYAAKEAAEEAFERWQQARREFDEYVAMSEKESFFDTSVEVELAPGVYLEETLAAGKLPVPPTMQPPAVGATPIDRIRAANRDHFEKYVIQFPYFPNVTSPAPSDPGPRPQHPDEIEGPWTCTIIYGKPDGLDYIKSLNLTRIDGSDVLDAQDVSKEALVEYTVGSQSEEYIEVQAKEEAEVAELKDWPIVPKWSPDYKTWKMQDIADIIRYNYSNVVDYVDREAMLTGKSILEPPVKIDPTCGNFFEIPPHAEPPKDILPDEPTGHLSMPPDFEYIMPGVPTSLSVGVDYLHPE